MSQKRFYQNLSDCAKATYIRAYNLALKSDFYKGNLSELDNRVFKSYHKYCKKPKKQFKILVYAAAMIYNNEIITDSNLCYDLNILATIDKSRLYKTHKFIQFVNKKLYTACIVPGVSYSNLTKLINQLLEGVIYDANNS